MIGMGLHVLSGSKLGHGSIRSTHLDLPLNDGNAMRRGHDRSIVNVRAAYYEEDKKETLGINYNQWLSTGYPNMMLEKLGSMTATI